MKRDLGQVPELILIRHAQTLRDPGVPSYEWRLTSDAPAACKLLAAQLEPFGINRIVTSEEFKARETGRLMAEALNVPVESAPGLHEHEKTGVPFMEAEDWRATLTRFFDHPNDLVLGTETGVEARDRFEQAVRRVLAAYPGRRLAIVSHATVMSLLVARYNDVAAQAFWKTLQMPDRVRLAVPGFRLLDRP